MRNSAPCSRRQLLVASLGLCVARTAGARTEAPPSLFVITRSKNSNVVHYDVRANAAGLDLEDPLRAYWIMHAEDGRREGLTWLERKLAYGWEVTSRVERAGFRMRIVAFKGREITVSIGQAERYEAHMRIAAEPAQLSRIHVRTDESGVMPRVVELTLFGRSLKTSGPLTERLKP